MHPCLNVDEIVRLIAFELVSSRGQGTAAALACCCKSFEDPVLDALWKSQERLLPLLESLPRDIWDGDGCNSFKRLPTTQEWDRFRKYARRIHFLDGFSTPPSKVLSVLQFRAFGGPLFPNLRILRPWCVVGGFVPFIPTFLSPKTTVITLTFNEHDIDRLEAASMITTFPRLCPNLQEIGLHSLPRDPMITAAISELLLTTNRDTLRSFHVDSPLTEVAWEVISKLPYLCGMSVVIGENTSLPPVVLPNLASLTVTHNGDEDWLRMFHGATLGKLETIALISTSHQIGDFLGAFERVALITSISATLSTFVFEFDIPFGPPWHTNYRSLLPFVQLKVLAIYSSCIFGCSSTIDDDTITDLARAMPMLEILRLGNPPCQIPSGVTVDGLTALAHHCLHLNTLRIHFQVASFDLQEASTVTSGDRPTIPWEDCGLTVLEVGDIPVPEDFVLTVAITLVRIFPHIRDLLWKNEEWEEIAKALKISKRIADRSRRTLEGTIRS